MKITNLIPTQDGYRLSPDEMMVMVDFVRDGGIYTEDVMRANQSHPAPLPIAINQFEDDLFFVRDGLHRLTSIFLGGRDELYPSEYVVEQYTYKRYGSVNLDMGWVTPFNPKTHVRTPNFMAFRDEVNDLIRQGLDPREFIFSNTHKYLVPRMPYHDDLDRLTRHFFPQLWKHAA